MKTGENMIGQGVFRDTDDHIPGVVEAKLKASEDVKSDANNNQLIETKLKAPTN